MLWTQADDQRVAALDPLDADLIMSKVPQWNTDGDIHQITSALRHICRISFLDSRNYHELLAIIRDIGILVGSLRKHGFEPIKEIPELEPILLRAGVLTDLIARDTVMHYTIWNPPGPRLRRYTTHPQEPPLIESVSISLPAIRDATRCLFELRDHPLHEVRSLRLAHQIAFHLKYFVLGLHHAMRRVDALVFIEQIRPFYEPIQVGGRELRGPGAVMMPLHIFDFLLWGSSEPDPRYQQFTWDYIAYNTAEFRQYYFRSRNTPSLLDRLESCMSASKIHPGAHAFVTPVISWMKRAQAFRRAHLQFAISAYQGKIKHSFASGSGGHTTADLEWLSGLIDKHALRVERMRLETTLRVPA
jgi:monodechloroaminopyrrolnitrin synthase